MCFKMAEIVDDLPPARRGGRPNLYPWDQWLDGRTRKLRQRVLIPGSQTPENPDGVMTPGDFTVSAEKMRQYARNKCRKRRNPLSLESRVTQEVVDGVKVGILYLKAVPRPAGEHHSLGSGAVVLADGAGADLEADLDVRVERPESPRRSSVPVVPEPDGTVDGVPIVRESELLAAISEEAVVEQPELFSLAGDLAAEDAAAEDAEDGAEDGAEAAVEVTDVPAPALEPEEPTADPDEWEQITPEEDPDDPFAGMTEEEIRAEVG
jgi:hypothetical protein